MSKQAVRTLRYWKHEGPRIIIASFTIKHKGINLNIIQAYAPTNQAADEDKDCIYNQLQSTVENLSKKDVNILMGDMNAKVGTDNTGEEEVMGIHGIGQVNDNEERFKGLCVFNQLVMEEPFFHIRLSTKLAGSHRMEERKTKLTTLLFQRSLDVPCKM